MNIKPFSGIVFTVLFDTRHPGSFLCIINFHRTGHLHLLDEMCVLDFEQVYILNTGFIHIHFYSTIFSLKIKDLEYWGIDAIWLELCCETKYAARKKFINETIEKEQAYKNACQV